MNVSISGNGDAITILRPNNAIVHGPFSISRASRGLGRLTSCLDSLSNAAGVIVRYANECRRPVVGTLSRTKLFVSVMGPRLVGGFNGGSLHGIGSSPTSTHGVTHCALSG